ncbi:hypothetical protein [Kitasatospora sp. NPDC057223]|uniref:hypothetical protein n=1 Tax=Kitasatospora sp. NPDC057223 TaxID=3346055 RepID=UPI0036399781
MALFRKSRPDDPADGHPAGAGGPAPGELAEELAELVEGMERGPALTGPARPAEVVLHRQGGRQRATRLVRSLTGLLGRGGRAAAKGAGYGGRALADRLLVAAPRIPVRNLATLRAQYPDIADRELMADLLVTGASRASAALGAGVGAAAMLPVPPAMAVEIAAETLAVAAVEIKLIAELHEVYGRPAAGNTAQRGAAYVTAWANRRGIDRAALLKPAGLVAVAVGSDVRKRLGKRLTRSSLRRLPSLTPLLIGAGIGANINRRDTRKLAGEVRADLRSSPPTDPAYWTAAAPGPATGGTGGRAKR